MNTDGGSTSKLAKRNALIHNADTFGTVGTLYLLFLDTQISDERIPPPCRLPRVPYREL